MSDLDLFMALPYSVEVGPEDCTDGSVCYLAKVVELDGCESHGDTPEEALGNLQEARRLFLQTMLEDGVQPPQPVAMAQGVSYARNTIWTVTHDVIPEGPADTVVLRGETRVKVGDTEVCV